MPKYGWKIDELIFEEDAKAMYKHAKNEKETVLISLLWTTGARPEELHMLKREKVEFNDQTLLLTIPTKKLGKEGTFKIRERPLEFARPNGLDTNIFIETIIKYAKDLPPETFLLPNTTRWQENVVNRLSQAAMGKKLCPYHFRHSVMSWMAHSGATIEQLMHFKGALSVMSVSPYLHAKPYIVVLATQRRTRGAPILPPSLPGSAQSPPASAEPKAEPRVTSANDEAQTAQTEEKNLGKK